MAYVPREVLEAPLQPLADSPTEKYYTEWRVFTSRLGLPDSEKLDNVGLERLEGYCLLDARALPGEAGCDSVIASEYEQEKPAIRERLALYHYYRARRGALLRLGDGARIALAMRGGDAYTGYTLRVETEPGSRAELLLVDTQLQEGLKTYRITIRVSEGSMLELSHLVAHQTGAAVYGLLEAQLDGGSRLVYRAGGRPGEMTRTRLEATLGGEHARIDAVLGYAADKSRRGDIITNVTHLAPRTVSYVSGKGLARDEAKLVLRGISRVTRSAPWSTAKTEMHVLVAGEKAKGRSVPMLEIYTGDVEEAGHSASATMILEDVLFYAATRGLSRDELLGLMERGMIERTGLLEVAEILGLF
ncbi:MAG: SufD family Fe-S cluster assembly protein [Desulfurococcales archaeon]|nr:SufD family Fe-S cluster assembly protein [Desulfurococcales archaeon]